MYEMLKPGQMAACRIDVERLVLWNSYECEQDEISDYIEANELFVIVDAVTSIQTEKLDGLLASEEWENGAYKVMSPRGIFGWVGAGWVIPIT